MQILSGVAKQRTVIAFPAPSIRGGKPEDGLPWSPLVLPLDLVILMQTDLYGA